MFLANMSHELRTPITGIVGLTRLLDRTSLDESQREYLRSIVHSGESLLEIVEDLLDFGRIEAGNVEISADIFSMDELVKDVVALLAPTAERQRCTIKTSITPSLPREVRGDAVRTAQILRNLVSNALKFAPGGEVRVDVEPAAPKEGAPRVRFSVIDSGVGIAEEELPRLFESFYQVDSSYSKRHEGTGLGLAISRRLVEMMGGEISVESKPGEGSTFSFELPLLAIEEPPVKAGEEEGVSGSKDIPSAESVTQRKILVAEDNAINRLYIERLLQAEGHMVRSVADGFQAVRAAREEPFDLILMDIQMPGLDGLEATKQIREFSQLPIIALTAYARPEEIESFYVQGMNRAVTKPINERQLKDAIAGISE